MSSSVVGKRVDRVQGVGLGNARASWEILPPRDRAEKGSAAGRVAGLSDNAKRWVGCQCVRFGVQAAPEPPKL